MKWHHCQSCGSLFWFIPLCCVAAGKTEWFVCICQSSTWISTNSILVGCLSAVTVLGPQPQETVSSNCTRNLIYLQRTLLVPWFGGFNLWPLEYKLVLRLDLIIMLCDFWHSLRNGILRIGYGYDYMVVLLRQKDNC
mgnify:CR=1 FL=1